MEPLVSSITDQEQYEGYTHLEELIKNGVAGLGSDPLFTTDASGLFTAYLDGLPLNRRQNYNCNSCKVFIEKYGLLARITPQGEVYSHIWNPVEAPPFFRMSVAEMGGIVCRSKITGVFLSSDKVWGRPSTPDLKRGITWSHLCGPNPNIYSNKLQNASQAMAEKREGFKMLLQALSDYPMRVAEEAVRVLKADVLTRSEKALGVAEWFLDLHKEVQSASDSKIARNLLWRAVALAPPGFTHIRSQVVATLFDDLLKGLSYESVKARWSEKLHPLQYQRPTAAPSEGAIDQAEKAFTKLGAGRALLRRFATLDDVLSKLWVPAPTSQPPEEEEGRLFDHLRKVAQEVKKLDLPPKIMTWEKFSSDVLPSCKVLEVRIPSHGNFYALVTAEDPEAPPIIQWDGLEGCSRNPVSWYVYNGGSSAHNWFPHSEVSRFLSSWIPVTCVFYGPSEWQVPAQFGHQGGRVMFALEGCRDGSWEWCGLGLFPECLKSEYRSFRSVIEAHSRKSKISGYALGNANGLLFQKDGSFPMTLRADGNMYTLDRWE